MKTSPADTRQACRRCNGAGGWVGWPDFTCYRCGGTGSDPKRAVEAAPRRKRCQACGGLESHWNGLYARQCPGCDVNHGREACPRCNAAHPDLAIRVLPACSVVVVS